MALQTRIFVRRAHPGDIAALPEIERSSAQAFRATAYAWVADDDITPVDAYPPMIFAGCLWVAENAGTVVGFVSAAATRDALHVLELAVAFPHQRSGVGRLLMQAAIQAARGCGYASVTLTTFRDVAFNAPFYRGLGFDILETPLPRLEAILSAERARGLEQRCAMRLVCGQPLEQG